MVAAGLISQAFWKCGWYDIHVLNAPDVIAGAASTVKGCTASSQTTVTMPYE